MYRMPSPDAAKQFLAGLLTCCDKYVRAGEPCSTCAEVNTVHCECIRCTATCGGNKWAAVPANEQKKSATAADKARITVEASRVRKNLPGVPEDLVGDFARLDDGAIKELFAIQDKEDLISKLAPSESYSARLLAVQKHGGIAPTLQKAVARTGELAPACGDAAVNLRAGRSRTSEQTSKLAAAAAKEATRLAEIDFDIIRNATGAEIGYDLSAADGDELHAAVDPAAAAAPGAAAAPTPAVPEPAEPAEPDEERAANSDCSGRGAETQFEQSAASGGSHCNTCPPHARRLGGGSVITRVRVMVRCEARAG